MTPTPILEYSVPEKSTRLPRAIWYWVAGLPLIVTATVGLLLEKELQSHVPALLGFLFFPSLACAGIGAGRLVTEARMRMFDSRFYIAIALLVAYVGWSFFHIYVCMHS